MGYKDRYADKIRRDYVTSKKSRVGVKRPRTGFLVGHDTGNPNSTAAGNRNWFDSKDKVSSSAQTFIDDKEILEILPIDEKAWHVLYNRPKDNLMFGDDANDIAVGTELCYGAKIDNEKAYDMYVWYHAYLCKKYNLDPKTKITGHFILDPGRKTDPVNAFKTFGKTWAQFLSDVLHMFENWETKTEPAAPVVTTPDTYTIKAKDTLWSIAKAYDEKGVTVNDLIVANPGLDPFKLKVGQVIKLKEAQNAYTPAKTVENPVSTVTYKYPLPDGVFKTGSKGDGVKQIQTALNAISFKCGDPDGKYGPKTADAVSRFQKVYLPYAVDGIYGDESRRSMQAVLKSKGY